MHRWMLLIVSYFHRLCKWKTKIIIWIENCRQTIHRNNYTGPRPKEIQGTALQCIDDIKFSNQSIFNVQTSTKNADVVHERNTHLPHTRISHSTHVLGILYLKKCSVYMFPPFTSYQYIKAVLPSISWIMGVLSFALIRTVLPSLSWITRQLSFPLGGDPA